MGARDERGHAKGTRRTHRKRGSDPAVGRASTPSGVLEEDLAQLLKIRLQLVLRRFLPERHLRQVAQVDLRPGGCEKICAREQASSGVAALWMVREEAVGREEAGGAARGWPWAANLASITLLKQPPARETTSSSLTNHASLHETPQEEKGGRTGGSE